MLVIFYNPWWTAALEQLQRFFSTWHRIPQTASISHSQAVHVTGKDRPNTKARPTQQSVKSGFCKRWISMASSATGSWFLQLQVHTNQRSPIHAIGNATGKVTSAYLRFGFPHGMLLPQLEISIYFQSSLATPSHLKKHMCKNRKNEHWWIKTAPSACMQYLAAEELFQKEKHNSKAHSTVKSGFCRRWISMALSATGSWFLQLQVHTNQRSHHSCNRQCNWQSHLRLKD